MDQSEFSVAGATGNSNAFVTVSSAVPFFSFSPQSLLIYLSSLQSRCAVSASSRLTRKGLLAVYYQIGFFTLIFFIVFHSGLANGHRQLWTLSYPSYIVFYSHSTQTMNQLDIFKPSRRVELSATKKNSK